MLRSLVRGPTRDSSLVERGSPDEEEATTDNTHNQKYATMAEERYPAY